MPGSLVKASIMTAEQLGNVCGFFGNLIVVFPAIKATRLFVLAERGKTLAKQLPKDQEKLSTWLGQITTHVDTLKSEWKPIDAWFLFGGLALGALSNLIPLLKSWKFI